MSFLSIFRKKRAFEDPEIMQEAARRSEEIRVLRHQTRLLEHQRAVKQEQIRIQRLEEELQPEEPEQLDPMMIMLLSMLFKGQGNGQEGGQVDLSQFIPQLTRQNQINQPQAQGMALQAATETDLSDNEIMAMLKNVPSKYLKMAKGLPPEIIKAYVKKNFDYSDKTIERAIQIIKR